jgi:hypothetical protein
VLLTVNLALFCTHEYLADNNTVISFTLGDVKFNNSLMLEAMAFNVGVLVGAHMTPRAHGLCGTCDSGKPCF